MVETGDTAFMKLGELKWDDSGLLTVVAQDRHSGEIRMVAHANEEALQATLDTGRAYFFSRSRQKLWCKGESSGNTLSVREVWADCDGDAVLYLVDPRGPSCHTGKRSCFFRRMGADQDESVASPTRARLWDTLRARLSQEERFSYTRSLLEAGVGKIGAKIREEAAETVRALESEADERVVSEAADLLYHLYVALLARGLAPHAGDAELARRFGTSGLEEKASRGDAD